MRLTMTALPILALLLGSGNVFAATAADTGTTPGASASSTTLHRMGLGSNATATANTGAGRRGRSGAASSMPDTGTSGAGAATGTAAGRYTTEAAATKACGASNVVWANTGTKAYHLSGDKFFGNTKRGAYMCMANAKAGGFHQAGQSAARNARS